MAFGWSEFSLSVLGKFISSLLLKALNYAFVNRMYMPIFMHKQELRRNLKRMPFIYKDLQLDLIHDFVEVEISSLDKTTLIPNRASRLGDQKAVDRLKHYRKALLFGDGGFGKTTFFRVAVLSILGDTVGESFFNKTEKLVPIYVPLKAIKNSSQNPILDSIKNNNAYFKGEYGLRRLLSLAKRRKLVLFLDGYDEAPYSGGFDTVRKELELILGVQPDRSSMDVSTSQLSILYNELRGCRVYLSSRREFFHTNPFKAAPDTPVWLLEGIGDRRGALVDKIFKRYNQADSDWLKEKLNYEVFLQQLAFADDSSLRSLSNSPLFLTVICYVYVSDLREGRTAGTVFREGASELVVRCVELLLTDLDDYKARGLSETELTALAQRRNSFPEEKMAFLKYAASESYRKKISVFSQSDLRNLAKNFFSSISRSTNAKKIAVLIESEDATVNLITQLIYCGVFVAVAKNDDQMMYDFPHRRFRETLAVEHFDSADGLDFLADNVDQIGLSELVLFFVDQTSLNQKKRVITSLGKKVVSSPGNQAVSTLFLQCLQRSPDAEFNQAVSSRVLTEIDFVDKPVLPIQFIDQLPNDERYLADLDEQFTTACKLSDAGGCVRWAMPYLRRSNDKFVSSVSKLLVSEELSIDIVLILLSICSFSCYELVDKLASYAIKNYSDSLTRNTLLTQLFVHLFIGRQSHIQNDFRTLLAKSYSEIDSEFSVLLVNDDEFYNDLIDTFAPRKVLVNAREELRGYAKEGAVLVPQFWY